MGFQNVASTPVQWLTEPPVLDRMSRHRRLRWPRSSNGCGLLLLGRFLFGLLLGGLFVGLLLDFGFFFLALEGQFLSRFLFGLLLGGLFLGLLLGVGYRSDGSNDTRRRSAARMKFARGSAYAAREDTHRL